MTRDLRSSLKADFLPLLITAASFGPYLMPKEGLRLEHFVIYPALPIALLGLIWKRRTALAFPPVAAVLSVLVGVTGWTLLVTLFGNQPTTSTARIVSQMENYVQPIAIILVLAAFVRPASEAAAHTLLQRACAVLIVMLALNTVLVVASIFVNLSPLLTYFAWDPTAEGETVSSRAASMGRYSGVFNQPVESGLTYTLGLFAWAYLTRRRGTASLVDYGLLGSMLVGGLLSVSKAFILGGVPLFALYFLPSTRSRRLLNWRLVFGAMCLVIGALTIFRHWNGLDYFLRLFQRDAGIDSNMFAFYSAGRFGVEDSIVSRVFTSVWEESPVYGLGFGSQRILDNAYLEFFAQGGLVALVGYFALLISLLLCAYRHYRRGYEEGRFFLVLVVFIISAGLGAPVVTINRFSTVFWVFCILIQVLFHVHHRTAALRAQPSRWSSGLPRTGSHRAARLSA